MILIYPDEVWGYIEENKEALESSDEEIAYDTKTGCALYLGVTNGVPSITAVLDVEEIDLAVLTADNVERVVQEFYDEYLYDEAPLTRTESTEDEDIKERKEELESLFEDLLINVFGDKDFTSDERKEVLEDILKYLADKFPERHIYRPCYMVSETGEEVFEEYPYDKWDF